MRQLALLATGLGAAVVLTAYGLFRVELTPATPDFPIAHAVIVGDDPAFATYLALGYAGWMLTVIGATFTTSVGWVRVLGMVASLCVLVFGVANLVTYLTYGVALGAALAYARPPHRPTTAVLVVTGIALVLFGSIDSVVGQPIGGWRILAESLGLIAFFALVGFIATSRLRDRQPAMRPSSS